MHQMVYVKHEVYVPLMQIACPAESQDHTFYLSTLNGERSHLGIHYLIEMFVLRPISCFHRRKNSSVLIYSVTQWNSQYKVWISPNIKCKGVLK